MAYLVLGLFCAILIACVALNISILYALAAGLALFLLYGRRMGHGWPVLMRMVLDGVRTVKNILLTFVLIGMLTALWRAAGTIPVIVCYASTLIRPSVFILMTFLLNCAISVLTGTAFGTVATMGVICAAMGRAMGVDARLIGGAALAGVYFGDRCSPVSTSALLVAALTGTSIFDNIRRMARSALVPFLLSCVVYAVIGLTFAPTGDVPDLRATFERAFTLHPLALLPAVVILALSALRVNVKLAMAASILTAIPLCAFLQKVSPFDMARMALMGFQSGDAEVAAMLNGGGIVSMAKVAGIVSLSSAYSGIFQKTGLLDGIKHAVSHLAKRTTPFAAALCTAVTSAMIACNQTLSIMLTHQLCRDEEDSAADMALDLEDTAVVVAPLVPWSIANAVPLAATGAPTSALLMAVYLYLLPLWRLFLSWRKKHVRREKAP